MTEQAIAPLSINTLEVARLENEAAARQSLKAQLQQPDNLNDLIYDIITGSLEFGEIATLPPTQDPEEVIFRLELALCELEGINCAIDRTQALLGSPTQPLTNL